MVLLVFSLLHLSHPYQPLRQVLLCKLFHKLQLSSPSPKSLHVLVG